MKALWLGCALAVVDQVDGPVALIELPSGRLVTLDRDVLPRRAGEGARLCVVLPIDGGPPRFTRAPRALIREQHD